MTAIATRTLRVYCKAKEAQGVYEADVVPDLSVTELVAGLNEADYLPALASGERWEVVHKQTGDRLAPNHTLAESGVQDGDDLDFTRAMHGAEA